MVEAVWAVGRGEAMCRGNHEADAWPSRHATNINVTDVEERPISTSGRCYSLEERLRSRGERIPRGGAIHPPVTDA